MVPTPSWAPRPVGHSSNVADNSWQLSRRLAQQHEPTAPLGLRSAKHPTRLVRPPLGCFYSPLGCFFPPLGCFADPSGVFFFPLGCFADPSGVFFPPVGCFADPSGEYKTTPIGNPSGVLTSPVGAGPPHSETPMGWSRAQWGRARPTRKVREGRPLVASPLSQKRVGWPLPQWPRLCAAILRVRPS